MKRAYYPCTVVASETGLYVATHARDFDAVRRINTLAPDPQWEPVEVFPSIEEACRFAAYMNALTGIDYQNSGWTAP